MRYQFLVDTYATEIEKVLSTWAMFDDDDLRVRPHSSDPRGRSVVEHFVHQSVSEDLWFRNMLGIAVTDDPLPASEDRVSFLRTYAAHGARRLAELRAKSESWWEEEVDFFEVRHTRAWVMTRRLTHTSHHRGQQTAMLRQLGRALHSNYGPTADTGGLMQNQAPVIYAYPSVDVLLEQEAGARGKAPLPGPGERPPTERPDPP